MHTRAFSSKAIGFCATSRCRAFQSIYFPLFPCIGIAGMDLCCKPSKTFTKEAIPAALSRWPICALIEPTGKVLPVALNFSLLITSPIELSSIGSPSGVPVPWPSI